MKKCFARALAGVLAFSVCLTTLALPVLAAGTEQIGEQTEEQTEGNYSLTVYIGEPDENTTADSSITVTSSEETTTLIDPETGAVATTTTTTTQWSGTDEEGLDVTGEGTRSETTTTKTEATDGPEPGQTTTTTTTDTSWVEKSEETGEGETDTPAPGTAVDKETTTTVTGSESATDSVTTDSQDRVVKESGSYAGEEKTTTETTDERTYTETQEPETDVKDGEETITGTKETVYKNEESVTPSPSAPPEDLAVGGGSYDGVSVTLNPGGKATETVPVDTWQYEPAVTEGTVEQTDEEGNVAAVTTTVKAVDENGKATGYTVTTTYPGAPGKTSTTTVVYTTDENGRFTGWTSKTVDSEPGLSGTKEESNVTGHTGPTTVEDADQPVQEAPEEITIIVVPEKPAESETTDEAGNTTKVTVENLYDTDGTTVIGYQVKTTVTDAKGTQISTASESVWGAKTTITTTKVTNYTTTETTTEQVTTTKTEQFKQAVTEQKVTICATDGELKASMGQIEGSVAIDYATLTTLLPYLENSKTGTTDEKTDLHNRKDNEDSKDYDMEVGGFQWLGEYGIESAIRVEAPGKSGGTVYTWQPHQFVLEDKEGHKYYVYCTDFEVSPNVNVDYDVLPLEESGYYDKNTAVSDHEDHVRAIALNGYWGTDEGTGSMSAFQDMLREAKDENGDPLFTEDDIKSVTPGMAITATQAAIWYYGNSGTQRLSKDDIVGLYGKADNNSQNSEVPKEKADLVNSIYQYLITLEEKPTTDNTLIREEDFAQEVNIKLNHKVDTIHTSGSSSEEEQADRYNVDLSFTMALSVAPSSLGDSLIVKVVQMNSDGSTSVLASGQLNCGGEGSSLTYDSATNTYTFAGLELESGAKLDLKLDGTQNLQQGVYLFRAKAGYKASQTFVGVGDVKQDINLSVELGFEVKDPTAWEMSETETYDQILERTTTSEFERVTTVTVKSAEITVTEETAEELNRTWEGEYERTYTYEESEEEKPEKPDKPDKPEEPEKPVVPVEIEKESTVPEASAETVQETLPQTGQNWALAGLLGAMGALLASAGILTQKKRRENEDEA